MDPLVSLYYYAPVCATLNALLVLVFEGWAPVELILERVGPVTLFVNCNVALLLNVSVVYLIGCASSLVLTLSGGSLGFEFDLVKAELVTRTGVLKDILLVAGSVILFGSAITFTQVSHRTSSNSRLSC